LGLNGGDMPQIEVTFDQIWLIIGVMSSSNVYLATGIVAGVFLYFSYAI
jgi:hypothetical protein